MIRALEDLPIREQYTYMDMRTIFVKNGIYAGEVTAKKCLYKKTSGKKLR